MNDTDIAWKQINICSADWLHAEKVGIRLGLWLSNTERAGRVDSWWFVRKSDCWRIRVRLPVTDHGASPVPDQLIAMLGKLRDDGVIRHFHEVIYEPETHAFGGPAAMNVAHHLFHHDSRHIVTHLATAERPCRLEVGLRLAVRLLQAAGQEWYEQGDIWAQVAAHRQAPAATAATATVHAVAHLITADRDTDRSPLHTQPAWPAAHEHAGRQLVDLARSGQLTRGLRAVLNHHLIFAWNRLGISAAEQHLIASTAQTIVLHHSPTDLARILKLRPDTDKVTPMPTATTDPTELRRELADKIAARGTFRTAQVEAAFRTVPRHEFLPDVALEEAYAPRPVVTRRAADGESLSSASSPNLVAEMLEQAELKPGHRVLEIGAATGINAALIREIVGATGCVITIEYDPELADGARAALDRAGYPDVTVVTGDGAFGAPDAGPFDRIIVTAGAWTLADAWWEQLAPDGRIVVPLRLHGSGLTRCLALDRTAVDQLRSDTTPLVCGFVPMRGIDEHDDHHVVLRDDLAMRVDNADRPDRDALATAIDHPPQQWWSGIAAGDYDPIGHLDLWLLTHAERPFGRLSVGPNARNAKLVTPAYRWAGAALYEGGTLAYLAFRPISDDAEELGVIAHGPGSETLAATLLDLLRQWNDAGRPNTPTVIVHGSDRQAAPTDIARPNCTITINF